jgi:hypothetical protein
MKSAAARILRPLKARGKRSKEPAGNSSKSVGPLADGWSRAPKPSAQPFFARRCARGKREQSWWLSRLPPSPIHDLRALVREGGFVPSMCASALRRSQQNHSRRTMKRFAPLAAFFGLVILSYSFSVAQDAFRGVTNLHGTYGTTGSYEAPTR